MGVHEPTGLIDAPTGFKYTSFCSILLDPGAIIESEGFTLARPGSFWIIGEGGASISLRGGTPAAFGTNPGSLLLLGVF